jgi:hypothetical protein
MKKERLEELKKICEAATAGPWEAQLIDDAAHEIWIEGSGFHCRRYPPYIHKPERLHELLSNAEFIAAARDAVPRLVAEVERLRDLHGSVLVALQLELKRIPESNLIKDHISAIKKALEETP